MEDYQQDEQARVVPGFEASGMRPVPVDWVVEQIGAVEVACLSAGFLPQEQWT